MGDAGTDPSHGIVGEDTRLLRVQDRLDQVSHELNALRERREAAFTAGREARSREASRAAVEVVHARFSELQAELEGLRVAMRNRGVIEQAKGMLMLRLKVDEDTAFDYLRDLSNRSNRKLADVAVDVVRTRAGEMAPQ